MCPIAKSLRACFFTVLVAFSVTGAAAPPQPEPPRLITDSEPFLVFDSLSYQGKPDLTRQGMRAIRTAGSIWRPGASRDTIDEGKLRQLVASFRNFPGPIYFDIEHWPVADVQEEVADRNIAQFIRIMQIAREVAPTAQFGYYALLPHRIYWPIVQKDQQALDRWHAANRRTEAIAQHVDIVFPSLYTFYDDPAGWERYARANLQEARRYQKPVYAFLWPQYHDSNAKLKNQYIPADFWRRQLELCRSYADGIVIWGGWLQKWDENAPWWQETKRFLQTLENKPSGSQP